LISTCDGDRGGAIAAISTFVEEKRLSRVIGQLYITASIAATLDIKGDF